PLGSNPGSPPLGAAVVAEEHSTVAGLSRARRPPRACMGRTLPLLAGLALEASAWHLFEGGALPGAGSRGDACGSVPVASLRGPGDFAVGTLEDAARGAVPACPVKEGTDAFQAGGHAGAFQVLENGQVAKISKAFQRPGDATGYLQRHVDASAVEFRVYMEMWCLRRLLELPDNGSSRSVWEMQALEDHPLMPFVTGGALAWAPQFYGICRLDDGHQRFYMVLQNLMGQFNKPCQMDVKLGYMTGEPDYSWKHVRHQIADMFTPSASHAARVVGYQAWDPVKREFSKPSGKYTTALKSLDSAVDTFMDAVPDLLLTYLLDVLTPSKDLLISMAAWWHDHGVGVLDAIGMSVLLVFECAPQQGVPAPKPLLKLIDFAHLYPHSEHEVSIVAPIPIPAGPWWLSPAITPPSWGQTPPGSPKGRAQVPAWGAGAGRSASGAQAMPVGK
ncbi:unnamed protein product, partial [Prorocentrum cordatum]